MSMIESYSLSSEASRNQRIRDIDGQELAMLDQLKAIQAERAAILQTLGVTALQQTPPEVFATPLASTA